MRMKVYPLAAAILLSTNAIAESDYLCIVDQVSGFHHDTGKGAWDYTTFLPGERFMISQVRQDIYRAETADAQNTWSAMCMPRTDQTEDSFSCENRTNELHFNRKELRFTAFRYFGYWNGSMDSVSIAIGTCFPN